MLQHYNASTKEQFGGWTPSRPGLFLAFAPITPDVSHRLHEATARQSSLTICQSLTFPNQNPEVYGHNSSTPRQTPLQVYLNSSAAASFSSDSTDPSYTYSSLPRSRDYHLNFLMSSEQDSQTQDDASNHQYEHRAASTSFSTDDVSILLCLELSQLTKWNSANTSVR